MSKIDLETWQRAKHETVELMLKGGKAVSDFIKKQFGEEKLLKFTNFLAMVNSYAGREATQHFMATFIINVKLCEFTKEPRDFSDLVFLTCMQSLPTIVYNTLMLRAIEKLGSQGNMNGRMVV